MFFASAECDFHLLRTLDNVIVRQDVPLLIDDEARALPLLRNFAVEEIELDRPRGDVHHRWQHLSVDGNVVLFFRVKGRSAHRLDRLHPPAVRYIAEDGRSGWTMVGAVEEKSCDQSNSDQEYAHSLHKWLGRSGAQKAIR